MTYCLFLIVAGIISGSAGISEYVDSRGSISFTETIKTLLAVNTIYVSEHTILRSLMAKGT